MSYSSIFLEFIGIVFFPGKDKRRSIASKSILSKPTYRLLQSSSGDPLIGFKVVIRLFRTVQHQNQEVTRKLGGSQGGAILDGSFKFKDLETDYLSRLGIHPKLFIAKEGLGRQSTRKPQVLLLILLFGIFTTALCVLRSRNRVNIALLPREMAELMALIPILKDQKVIEVYDFIPFEKDSNLLYVILSKMGMRVNKFPSPGPLALHHMKLLAHTLYLNTPYQLEELQYFNSTIVCHSVEKIPPEYAYGYIDRYRKQTLAIPTHHLGYYSHGSWVRKISGHTQTGLNIGQKEDDLLKLLAQIQGADTEELLIFCHPRELKEGMIDHAMEFYGQFGLSYKLSEKQLKSTESFDKVDIGICAYSSIIYERLFCGFKTLIYTPDSGENVASFPIDNSAIRNICFKNGQELLELICHNSKLTNQEFFIENDLKGYPHWDFKSSYFE